MSLTPWTVADGGYIKIEFTMPLTGTNSGNEAHFTVSWQEYNYVPGGTVSVSKSYAPYATFSGEDEEALVLEMAWNQRFNRAVGQVRVQYDGGGTLQGEGGSVEPFDVVFTPTDLVPKDNPNEIEHLEISAISATGALTKIDYKNAQDGGEHITISGITVTGALTHVGDL